jgi:hypothetical protein
MSKRNAPTISSAYQMLPDCRVASQTNAQTPQPPVPPHIYPCRNTKNSWIFQSAWKILKTSRNMENAPKSLILILVFQNCSAVVAKFKVERLGYVGVWPVNPSIDQRQNWCVSCLRSRAASSEAFSQADCAPKSLTQSLTLASVISQPSAMF